MLILIVIIIIIIVMYMYDVIWFSKDEQKIEKQTQTKEGEQKKKLLLFCRFHGYVLCARRSRKCSPKLGTGLVH